MWHCLTKLENLSVALKGRWGLEGDQKVVNYRVLFLLDIVKIFKPFSIALCDPGELIRFLDDPLQDVAEPGHHLQLALMVHQEDRHRVLHQLITGAWQGGHFQA